MTLDQETTDRITLAAATMLLDKAEFHMARWKEDRQRLQRSQVRTGLAQAGELGFDLLPMLAAAVGDAWAAGWQWCADNRDSMVSSALVSAIIAAIQTRLSGLGKAESEAAAKRIAEEVAAILEDRLRRD